MRNNYIKIIKYYLKEGGEHMKSKNACGSRERDCPLNRKNNKSKYIIKIKTHRFLKIYEFFVLNIKNIIKNDKKRRRILSSSSKYLVLLK